MSILLRPLLPLIACAAGALAADHDQPFPFAIAWEPEAGSAADASALVPAPVRGRLVAAGDRLVDESGAPQRLVGVNISGPANFMDPAEAPALARRLRWLGVNCVRLHHMDTAHVQPNLFAAGGGVADALAPASLERLDALIAALAGQGIRVDLNLHVGRVFGPELGLPAPAGGPAATGKAISFIEPRAIAAQRRFAAALLDRVNPLRGLRLADDPALALVEMVNEDGLVCHAGDLASLPAPTVELLRQAWNAFLLRRHSSTAAMLAAWNRDLRPPGPDLLAPAAQPGLGLHKEEFAPASVELEPLSEDGVPGLRVIPRTGSATDWHLQLHRKAVALQPRRDYSWVFWARAERPRRVGVSARLDHQPWTQVGLERSIELGTAWRRYALDFTSNEVAGERCRLSWSFAGGEPIPFALRQVSLHEGSHGFALGDGESLEAGNLPLGSPGAQPPGRDWLDCLIGLEESFTTGMRDYIHRDLGCRAPVIASQTFFGGLAGVLRESRMDVADTHAYWQHPEFPRSAWSPTAFTIANSPMSACGGPGASILHRAAASRPAGRPFTVTEYDHAAPSEYAADTVPLAFAVAARQDWSGLFLFQYLWSVDAHSRQPRIRGWFDNVQHPAKLAFLPAAAEMFLAGAMPAAGGSARLGIPRGQVAGITAASTGGSAFWHDLLGGAAGAADLTSLRLEVAFGDGPRPVLTVEPVADARPLRWNAAEVLIAAPRVAGAIGRIRGRELAAGALRIAAERSARDYAAAVVVSRDAQPLTASRRMLLTIIDKAENSGLVWQPGRQAADTPWDGEVLVTGVSAAIALRCTDGLQVWALDGAGRRQAAVASAWADGELRFRTSPAERTVWYEIAERPVTQP
ncbi:MAG: carbohydrate binding domain-containing protein [Planctomycetes bacterium]|nr:carbohydrate binding domain-containing protein [Planctomycetota bacterium]